MGGSDKPLCQAMINILFESFLDHLHCQLAISQGHWQNFPKVPWQKFHCKGVHVQHPHCSVHIKGNLKALVISIFVAIFQCRKFPHSPLQARVAWMLSGIGSFFGLQSSLLMGENGHCTNSYSSSMFLSV